MLNGEQNGGPEKLVFSIPDTAQALGDISESTVRNLIRSGSLERVRIGRRVMVSSASIKRLLEAGKQNEQAA